MIRINICNKFDDIYPQVTNDILKLPTDEKLFLKIKDINRITKEKMKKS